MEPPHMILKALTLRFKSLTLSIRRSFECPRGSPIEHGDQSLRFLEALHLPTEILVSHCKGHKKGARKWHKGTKQPIRQLRDSITVQ